MSILSVRGVSRSFASTGRAPTVALQATDLDVEENDTGYSVKAEIPGVKKEDIRVEVDGNQVSISAEVKQEREVKEGERVLRSERYFGKVSRSFQLPVAVDESRTTAKYEDGVLTLTLPKQAAPSSRRIAVE